MSTSLSSDAQVVAILRTHKQQDVQATARAVLERVGGDPAFARQLNRCAYAALRHRGWGFHPFDWQTTPQVLLADLINEPRAGIYLEGPYPSAHLWLDLNCKNEMVKEKVDGRLRSVPKASDTSDVLVSATAKYFSDPAHIQAYLDLIGDLFEIIGGGYGHADHSAIRHWANDFDHIHWEPFEPSVITWANVFGPELVARFGRARLLSTAAHHVREMPGGSIVLTVAASPLEQLQPEVQERIARIKAHLGILSPSERAAPEELAATEARRAAAQAEMKRRIEEAFRRAREETAAEMQRQADGCVEGVLKFWRTRLDFRPQSLAVVDRLIQTGFGSEEDEETIAGAVQAFGAFVGEVVRRTYGGVWHDEEMKGQPILLKVGPEQIRIEPFVAVRKRFEQRLGRESSLERLTERIVGRAPADEPAGKGSQILKKIVSRLKRAFNRR